MRVGRLCVLGVSSEPCRTGRGRQIFRAATNLNKFYIAAGGPALASGLSVASGLVATPQPGGSPRGPEAARGRMY